eukprot:gene5874-4194_t
MTSTPNEQPPRLAPFFDRAALWNSIEKELQQSRRSAVAQHVLVAERWTTLPFHDRNSDDDPSDMLEGGVATKKPLPFMEYWESPWCGAAVILVALNDRLALRTTFSGDELSISYGDVLQIYADHQGELLELVCSAVTCSPPLTSGCAPHRTFHSRTGSTTSTPCTGRTPDGGAGEASNDREDAMEEIFIPDTHAHSSPSCTSSAPPQKGKPSRRSSYCYHAPTDRRSGPGWQPQTTVASQWSQRKEFFFSFQSPSLHGGTDAGLLVGEPRPLWSLFQHMAPRVACQPLGTIAPLRRFQSPPNRIPPPPSHWLYWLQQCFRFEAVDVHRSGARDGADGQQQRPSIAEVLGYAAHGGVPCLAGCAGREFDWDQDVQDYVQRAYIDAADALPPRTPSAATAPGSPEPIEVLYGPTLIHNTTNNTASKIMKKRTRKWLLSPSLDNDPFFLCSIHSERHCPSLSLSLISPSSFPSFLFFSFLFLEKKSKERKRITTNLLAESPPPLTSHIEHNTGIESCPTPSTPICFSLDPLYTLLQPRTPF